MVQVVHSGIGGSPQITGQSGSLSSFLKTVLVDGWNLVSLDSIVVASNVATITRAAGLQFAQGVTVRISGATPGSLNGDWPLLTSGLNTATFATSGIIDQTASVAGTAKIAALGYDRPYNATNIEVFRSPNTAGCQKYLRVDDSGAAPREARVKCYSTMTDVSTGSEQHPSDALLSGGGFWTKSATADAVARPWVLIGDDRTFYLMVAYSNAIPSANGYAGYGFGDIDSLVPSDADGSFLQCGIATSVAFASGSQNGELLAQINTFQAYSSSFAVSQLGFLLAKAYTGASSGGVWASKWPSTPELSTVALSTTLHAGGVIGPLRLGYPNLPNGAIYLARPWITEGAQLRGTFRGLFFPAQAIGPSVFAVLEAVTGVTGLPGRTVRMVNSGLGCCGFDTTGPW